MGERPAKYSSQQATIETTFPAPAFYRSAANLELLPRWWYLDDPNSVRSNGTRVARDIDGKGFLATAGSSVEIVSSGAKNHLLGKQRWTELPSVIRFTCEIADPGSHLRFTHQPTHGVQWQNAVSTDIAITTSRGLTTVTLTQTFVARGRGPGAMFTRWVQSRFDFHVRNTLDKLVHTAESEARPGQHS
jgi:hypothetical protein